MIKLYYAIERLFLQKKYKRINKEFYQIINKQQLENKKPKSILFYPDMPNPRAAISVAFRSMGYQITNQIIDINNHDFLLAINWKDDTIKPFEPLLNGLSKNGLKVWNNQLTDISKSKVDEAHMAVFSYSTRINPLKFKGTAVEKTELNAKHIAEIIQCPITLKKEGFIYQKLINNQFKKGLYADIRVVIIASKVASTYLSFRIAGSRFSAKKHSSVLVKPNKVLSKQECEKIEELCTYMHLDYGELDVLRDNDDGKIYIVDVNDTPYGPANGLKLEEKLQANDITCQAIKRVI